LGTDKVIKAAGVVGLGTFLSRILGLVRLQVIAYTFGYSAITDAFWIGFTLPNLLRSLLAEGALSTAFIPVFSEWLAKKGEKYLQFPEKSSKVIKFARLTVRSESDTVTNHEKASGKYSFSGIHRTRLQ